MSATTQLDHDPYRVLIYRRDASELLLESSADGLALPVAPVPRFTRVAEKLTAGIKDQLNLDVCCLFPVLEGISSSVSIPFQVVELSGREAETPVAMRWLEATSLSAADFRDHDDFVAVQTSLVRLEGFRRGELIGAFGKPGWLRTVTEWVASRAATAQLSLTGKFRQLNASPTFSLLRFETDGPALWFKAVGEPNLREFPITLKLAATFPNFLPHLLASRPEWNAWLVLEAQGRPLDSASDPSAWEAAAEKLALLQRSTFGMRFELLEAGCQDLRAHRLREFVDPFFESMTTLMKQQAKSSPAPLSDQELISLRNEIRNLFEECETSAIPSTLGHLDMNLGNLIVHGTRCTFLDWAEAYVGPPFLTFQYLFERFRRVTRTNCSDVPSIVAAYSRMWNSFASPAEIGRTLRITPLVAAFTYAATGHSWQNPETVPPRVARFLRSLTRRMWRESIELAGRRAACPS